MKSLFAALLLMVAGCANAHPQHSVRIDMEKGVCTATAVGPNLLLTAEHCFDAGGRLQKIEGEEHYALEIVRDGKDHALVRVTKTFPRWAVMGPALESGENVEWIGTPAGVDRVLRRGYVMKVADKETWIDAQAFGGDSGSALVDSRGRVRAVLTGVRVWRDRAGNTFTAVVVFPLAFTEENWRDIRA